MALSAGTRLGAYEILSLLGSGGMGEVYRARDTRLNRDVALKILPDVLASDPDRLARLTREAQTLAALNHPNIAHIYGLEESDGIRALVMELVEGEDLARRIARGAIPLDEALPIARQIADALEAAHEQGIIHRDLKPANIKVRDDGTVKVLDFGLAKALDPATGSNPNVTNSPTLTTPAMMTGIGVILGTAAYMAPEQAKGRAVDKRTDVWAFGCVFFEMLTGRRAFYGEDVTDTIAAIVRGEPDWAALPADVPEQIRLLLKRCLEKDRRRRVSDMGVARFLMSETIATARGPQPEGGSAKQRSRPVLWAIIGVAAGLVVAATGSWVLMRPPPRLPPHPMRFTVVPSGTLQRDSPYRDLAISPDGAHLVYGTGSITDAELWVRPVDRLDAVQLRGLTSPVAPFISADSKWIGFGSGRNLMKVSMTGGPPILLCPIQGILAGASWGSNDTIVFATNDPATGLLRVPAGGGEPQVLTRPDKQQGEVDHMFPSVLPGNQAVLFTITASSGRDDSRVAVLDLKTGQRKPLIRNGGHAEYVDPSPGSGQAGYLIYAAAGTLRAVRFDPDRLEVQSDAVPIVDEVLTKALGAAEFSVSRSGALVYVPGGINDTGIHRSLVWVNRQGREEPIRAPVRAYFLPRLSPDGNRIALDVRDQDNDIWTWDLAHETLTRITKSPAFDIFPIWTHDGQHILFASARDGVTNLYWQSADGTGSAERLTTSQNPQMPLSISPDGTHVVVRDVSLKGGNGLHLLDLGGPSTSLGATKRTEPLLPATFPADNGIISPDSHWFAYESNESGQYQIYVRPFPNVNAGLRQVSSGGGRSPVWEPRGRELFYLDGNGFLTTVPVQTSTATTFNFGKPTKLLNTKYFTAAVRTYDISRDGQKFLMIKDAPVANQPTPISIVVVLNWFEELTTRLPAK